MYKIERTRLHVAESLLELLQNQRIQDITTVELINQAQISKRTFYNHFADKHDVFSWWWTDQLLPYVDKNIDEVLYHELSLFQKYNRCFRNVICYTGQNNFMDDAVALASAIIRKHVRKEILLGITKEDALRAINYTAKSSWVFKEHCINDLEYLVSCMDALKERPDDIVLAGTLSCLTPYYSYRCLPRDEHV